MEHEAAVSILQGVLVRAGVHRFLFSEFNFNNVDIDNVISSYDDESKELIIFGRRVCLDLAY